MNTRIFIPILLISFAATSAYSQVKGSDTCAILANRLTPDVLVQGSSNQRFAQLQQLIADNKYDSFSSASSSDNSFSLGISIVDIVDLAIGDKNHSNESNWRNRRSQFRQMNFQETNYAFQTSNYLSQTSDAIVREISQCAQAIAGSRANGVFIHLDTVSPNRDAFAIQLAYRTEGNPSDWSLTDFHVEPDDPSFSCRGFEKASDNNKIPLITLTKELGCSKSSKAHLTLVVNTSQGGAAVIPLDSKDEQIEKLRSDMEAAIASLAGKTDKSMSDIYTSISGINGQLQQIGPQIFQCPSYAHHAGGSEGGGSWGFYGCHGQITNDSTCDVIEWPHRNTYQCAPIGRLRYAP